MKMIKKINGIDCIPMPNRKGKGMTRKKTIVLIAVITATLALSITAYGISKGINKEKDDVYIAPAVPADHVSNLGEEISDETIPDRNLIFTVNKVEIMDKLPEVNENYFWGYYRYLEAINEDGTLKDYERSVSIKWENNEMKKVTETAGRKFAYVTLTLRNPSDKELKDVYVSPIIEYRTKASDGTLEAFPDGGGNDIAKGKWPIYFDQSDYPETHLFFCNFEPNETKEVHLIYLLDDDHLDDAYFTQRRMSISADGNDLTNVFGYYVKIK